MVICSCKIYERQVFCLPSVGLPSLFLPASHPPYLLLLVWCWSGCRHAWHLAKRIANWLIFDFIHGWQSFLNSLIILCLLAISTISRHVLIYCQLSSNYDNPWLVSAMRIMSEGNKRVWTLWIHELVFGKFFIPNISQLKYTKKVIEFAWSQQQSPKSYGITKNELYWLNTSFKLSRNEE